MEYRVRHTHENTIESPARIVMAGEDTAGSLALVEALVTPEDEPPLHLHTREDEMVYVIDGAIEVALDGTRSRLAAGDAISLPRNREHAWRLLTGTARLLVISAPAGIEGFYAELDRSITQDHYVERLITLAARYGIEITGPGLRDSLSPSGNGHQQEGG